MKARPEEELDEAKLQSLFERTAELPSGPTLTKLVARAADVPRNKRRDWSWLSLRLALPASVVAVAAAVVIVPRLGEPPAPGRPAPVALAAASSAPALAPLETDQLDPQELVASIDFDDVDGSELSLDLMHEPASEAELDAWLVATATLLDEGG
jgi:hypothetical protein